jgi:hypothetical protein
MLQFLFWAGTTGVILLIIAVGYFWRENGKLKKDNQNEVVETIKNSINNLSTTITVATEKFEKALKETRIEFGKISDDMWIHIGELREDVSWLTGQHEVNHGIRYDGPERRSKPRPEKVEHCSAKEINEK